MKSQTGNTTNRDNRLASKDQVWYIERDVPHLVLTH